MRFEEEHIGLLLLAIAVAVSGWLWAGRRADLARALAYAAGAYPGASVQARRPLEAKECGVVLLQVDGRRWVLFDLRRGDEAAAMDENAVAGLVRAKLRLAGEVPVQLVDARNTADTDGLFVAGVNIGEGSWRGRWEMGVDVQGCRLIAMELAQRNPLTGDVVRHAVMKPAAPARRS